MLERFTFVTISYNQEEYILEHLSSIAYQIRCFGKGIKFDYIFADDCSTDGTTDVAKKWLANNGHLFESVEILKEDHNLGTVGNTVRALKAIKSEYFLILSADDLVYKNDIFKYADADVIISPTVIFGPEHADYCNLDILFEAFLYKDDAEKLKSMLANRMKLHIAPYLVSVFFSYSTVTEKMLGELSKYKWIEDYPILKCLFESVYRTKVVTEPLVLYRGDVGISNNSKHERRLDFKIEEDRVNKEICTHYKRNMYVNPYQYIYHFQRRINQIFKFNKNADVKIIQGERKRIECEVNEFRKRLGNEF